MAGSAALIADRLKRDGYNISSINGAVVALEEDLEYSYEEAIALAPFIVKEA